MYKIGILFQNRDFEHDVYELIKAFYPGNEIVSLYEEDDADYDIRFRVSRDEEGYTISYNKTRSNTLCIRCFPKLQERHFPGEILQASVL